jgi:hypothetical protein
MGLSTSGQYRIQHVPYALRMLLFHIGFFQPLEEFWAFRDTHSTADYEDLMEDIVLWQKTCSLECEDTF